MGYCVGIDWGGLAHAVCVVDDANGMIVDHFEVVHGAAGLSELLARLARIAAPAELPVAIERPSGLLVETLIEAGHPVVPIHPNVVKACRPRYRAAGGKSDPWDGYMIADILRTDGHRFRALTPCSDEIKALRALVRTRDDLVAKRVAVANQLRSLLDGFWPGADAIFGDIDSRIALAFLQRYPTPDSAQRLGEKRLAAFLAKHHYSGGRGPTELLARLRAAPTGHAGPAEAQVKGDLVLALVAVLQSLRKHVGDLTRRLERDVAALPDGGIIMSFPRAGRICAAQILAELGDVRERFQTADHLAAEAGVCPVTHASGKSRGVKFRWACNHRLRRAITCFADNSRHDSKWAQDIYLAAKKRGCRHAHAIRILARAWIRIIWRAWVDHATYDLEKHRAAMHAIETG